QNIFIGSCRAQYIGIGGRSRYAKTTRDRNTGAGFQSDNQRWQSGELERLSRQMGGALFLSERFHERLHDGGKKFPARSCEVRTGERSRSRCERGHGPIAQGFLRERRTQFQIAGRPRRESLDRIWVG